MLERAWPWPRYVLLQRKVSSPGCPCGGGPLEADAELTEVFCDDLHPSPGHHRLARKKLRRRLAIAYLVLARPLLDAPT